MHSSVSSLSLNTRPLPELPRPAGESASPRRTLDSSVDKVAAPVLVSEGFPERPKSPPPQRMIDKYKQASPRASASNTVSDPLSALSRQVQAEPVVPEPQEVPAPVNLSLANPHLKDDLFTLGEGRGSLEVAQMLVEALTNGKVFTKQEKATDEEVIVIQTKPRAPTSPAPSPPLSRHATSGERPRQPSAPPALQPHQAEAHAAPEAPESPRKARADSTPWQAAVVSPPVSPSPQRRGTSFVMGQRSAPASPQPSPPASPATARKREDELLADLIFRPKTTCIEVHVRIMCAKLKEKKFEDIKKFIKKSKSDQAALFQAVSEGNYETIMKATTSNRELVESCRDSSGRTIMHVAVKYNRDGIVDLLVAKKFQPDVKADKGAMCRTPLHEAVIAGHYRITCALLATGQCDPDAKDLKGLTPLHYAAIYGHDHLIAPLCKAGATMTMNCVEKTCSEVGLNALQMSVAYAHVKVFEALLEQVKNKQERDMLTKKTLTEMLYEVASRCEVNEFMNFDTPLNAKNILNSEGLLKEEYEPIIKVLALFRAILEEVRKENNGRFESRLYVQRAKNEGNAAAERLFMQASQFDAANEPANFAAPKSPRSTTMDAVASRLKGLQIE